jgi:ribulose-phosphate 3-epimerase
MSEVVGKISQARRELDRRSLRVALEVDGGIDPETVGEVARAGADTFVAGSAIFGHPDPLGAAKALRHAANAAA